MTCDVINVLVCLYFRSLLWSISVVGWLFISLISAADIRIHRTLPWSASVYLIFDHTVVWLVNPYKTSDGKRLHIIDRRYVTDCVIVINLAERHSCREQRLQHLLMSQLMWSKIWSAGKLTFRRKKIAFMLAATCSVQHQINDQKT